MKIVNIILCKHNSTLVTDKEIIISIPASDINNNFLTSIVIPEVHEKGFFECSDNTFFSEHSIKKLLESFNITMPESVEVDKVDHIIKEAIRSDNIDGLKLFTERLKKVNTERNFSVQSCIDFLKHSDLPITVEGNILGYKYLDYKKRDKDIFVDCHTHKIEQRLGSLVQMDIDSVDPDRSKDCSYGLHVASKDYLENFSGDVLVLVKVRPEDIISVPLSDTSKIRVCAYQIISIIKNKNIDMTNEEISHWINNADSIQPKEIVKIKGNTQEFEVISIKNKTSTKKKSNKVKTKKISKDKENEVNNVQEIVDKLRKRDIELLVTKFKENNTLEPEEVEKILSYKKQAKKSLSALFGIHFSNSFRRFLGEIG